jgi:succinylarginine dihydrolase
VVTKNPPPARELPPAILVFRDGRQQEINSYTIMNGTIFTRSNYWITGSWNQKIQIADLDVPATLRQNQQRGLKFNLPSSANEVIVRP